MAESEIYMYLTALCTSFGPYCRYMLSYSVLSSIPASAIASFLSMHVPHFPQCLSPPL